jgi:CRP/FNR family transcriptional regulator, cyclic AMP receptor protein
LHEQNLFLTTPGSGKNLLKSPRDRVLFSQGDPADSVFYIQSGKVKITVVSEHGKEAVVAVLGADQFCGQGCLAGQTTRMSTASTITDSEVTRLDKALVIKTLQDDPVFSELFVQHLLKRAIRVEEDLIDQLFNSSEKRLARALLLLANYGTDGAPEPILTKVSQEMLADMIGTTRSRVSFFMNKFRRLGFIDYNGHIEVRASLLSVLLNDNPHTRYDE